MPKAAVVTLLRAGRDRHGNAHRLFHGGTQVLEDGGDRPSRGDDDISRGEVRNVRGTTRRLRTDFRWDLRDVSLGFTDGQRSQRVLPFSGPFAGWKTATF